VSIVVSDYLADINRAGLEVDWLTLLLGLDGPGKHAPLLSLADVETFATEELESSPASPRAFEVLVALGSGPEETRAVLRKLVAAENLSPERELRKWRVVLLKQTKRHLPTDSLYGLLALTEFWAEFDFPSDSPHVIQGRGNPTSPPAYFTEENYRDAVQRHLEWIDAEMAALRDPMV
jgi:hypothetical protein